MFDLIKIVGEVKYRVTQEGLLLFEAVGNNLVVTQGRTNILKLLGGDTDGKAITKVGVGTGSLVPALGDTTITSGFTKAISGVTYPTSTTVTFAFNIASAEANGKAIREFALFNDNDVLCARYVIANVINKTSAISIDGTWTIKL